MLANIREIMALLQFFIENTFDVIWPLCKTVPDSQSCKSDPYVPTSDDRTICDFQRSLLAQFA